MYYSFQTSLLRPFSAIVPKTAADLDAPLSAVLERAFWGRTVNWKVVLATIFWEYCKSLIRNKCWNLFCKLFMCYYNYLRF